MPAVRHARAVGVTSLLDLSEQQWRHSARSQASQSALFLLDARDALESLRDGTGWEIEYPEDVWRLHKLPGITIPAGRPCPRARLRFDRITQPWLRDLAKRWTRLRVASGLSIGAARGGVDALTCFSRFLTLTGTDSLAEVDRPLLERFLAHVASLPGGRGMKKTRIGALNLFFQNIRQHGWDNTLPGTAAFYLGDIPPVPEQADRRLAEYVMAQVEAPANLDRWPSPAGRLITLILTRCGLRISSALALGFDCLLRDGQGAPYLRYFNTKMRREAAVPIDEELEAAIGDQQRWVLSQWPDGTTCLFPRERANVSGNLPLADGTYRRMLGRWLATCEVRDEHGRPVHLTPHQWRHTFACRLINRDVPQEVVRVLLDHDLRQDPGLDTPGADRPGTGRSGEDAAPRTRYALTEDGVHIAYQVIGEGERDIVFVPGLMSHLELAWEDDETSDFYRRLAGLGRLILFDKRDTGLSDRAPGDMSLEERMEDVRAVMRAAGSSQAVLFGYSEGAPMSLLFAATYPGRVTALILGSASARWFPAPGYPCGQGAQEMYDGLVDIATHRWSQGATVEWYLPSLAGSADARQRLGRFERMAVNPSAFLRMARMIRDIDVRAVLPSIHVPTLVIQRLGDRITPPCHGRYLASHIAGARYFEQSGDHSLRFAGSGDSGELCAEIADFLAGTSRPDGPDRVLATILRVRASGARPPAPRPGTWDKSARQVVRGHRGRLVAASAESFLATFDSPGQAIRCAVAVREDAAALGMVIRAGIHAGEVELAGDDIAGISVQVTDRVAAHARAEEILATRTVRDLVTGSGIIFTEQGTHHLDGESERQPLFAVAAHEVSGG